jgi:hypothetical protein
MSDEAPERPKPSWEQRVWDLRERMRRRRPPAPPKLEIVPDDAPDPEEPWWQK